MTEQDGRGTKEREGLGKGREERKRRGEERRGGCGCQLQLLDPPLPPYVTFSSD